jgi:drug/metabolite transporter (DMT)-like permease
MAPTLLAYAAIYLIWGSTYLAIRVAVGAIPPLLLMGVRCALAGSALLGWAAWRGERATAAEWRRAVIAGGLMIACTYGALAWAEQRLASGVAALLSATPPIWLTAAEWRRGARPRFATVAAILLGLGGVALLVGSAPASQVDAPAALVLLASTIAWAAGSLYGRPPRLPASVALGAGMPLVTGGAMLLAASALAREPAPRDIVAVPHAALWALAYLIVFGTLVAFSAYSWLLRVAPASRVATHAYVNPLIAVALGWSVAGEPITATTGIAAGVIAASVAVIVRGR